MSQGIVVCSECRRELHQDGPNRSWRHCEDKSPKCQYARPIFPDNEKDIVGKYCGKDKFY